MRKWILNLGLLAIVVALAASALIAAPGSQFGGADDQAVKAIGELAPNYQPWFAPLWQPPGAEMQSLLFSLQAALGSGIVGYAIGYWSARRQLETKSSGRETGSDAQS